MADEPENLILRLLQEMRFDMQKLQASQIETQEQIKDLSQRVDGNTLILNLIAGVAHDHEQRIERLEEQER